MDDTGLGEDVGKREQKRKRSEERPQTRFKDGVDDSFRIYMSRKVELQRKQFGLIVPPPPTFSNQTTNSNIVKKNQLGATETTERIHAGHQTELGVDEYEVQTDPIKTKRKDLFFAGVVVIVNGYTNPDAPTIMRLLHKHGGDLEKYETRRITHIIAEHLSVAKANIYKKQRNPTPVVYPSWIVDSVEKGKLLPYGDYLIDEIRDKNSSSLTKSFGIKTKKVGLTNQKQDPPSLETNGTTNSNYHQIRTVGNDPNFLEAYFSTSRLSFIGSYRQRSIQSSSTTAGRANYPAGSQHSKVNTTKFVFHVDMDCFFASVVLRNYPQYKQKPVAIGHNNILSKSANTTKASNAINEDNSANTRSTSELSTCNYIARRYGIRKGMWLHQAKSLCPNLIVLPYDYDGYEQVSNQVSEILFAYAKLYNGTVELVSCDEAYVELWVPNDNESENSKESSNVNFATASTTHSAKSVAEIMRKEIFTMTECTASIGCSSNKFLAKLATDKAKPNASLVVAHDEWKVFLKDVKLRDLPGIGYKLNQKLSSHQFITVQDVWDLGKGAESELCQILGQGNGKKIVQFCYGNDARAVAQAPRKTIGAECNYGVRFDGPYGVDYMILGLAKEVEKRMKGENVKGKHVTVKIKQRKKGALEPSKFNGHGPCYNLSKSDEIPGPLSTWDHKIIAKVAMNLFGDFEINKDEIRGMGIVMSKLEECDIGANGDKHINVMNGMSEWLTSSNNNESLEPEKAGEGEKREVSKPMKRIEAKVPKKMEKPPCSREILGQRARESPLAIVKNGTNQSKSKQFECSVEKNSLEFASDNIIGTSGKTQDDHLDVMIPNPTQIDITVLKSLPMNIQQEISRKLADSERTSAQHAFTETKHTTQLRTPTGIYSESFYSGNSNRMVSHTPSKADSHRDLIKSRTLEKGDKVESNKRQTSVKRMLKLASIKSGQEKLEGIYSSESISMTQLDALPLEMQLQVANNDENPLGSIKKKGSKKMLSPKIAGESKSPYLDNIKDEPNALETESPGILKEREKKDIVTDCNSTPCVLENDFNVKNNIIPLSEWLYSVPSPNKDDIDKVRKFFFIVLSENRLDDVLSMLRHIKNRKDSWRSTPYDSLLQSVNQFLHSTKRGTLDVVWLGL